MGVLFDEGGGVLLDEAGAVLYDEAGSSGGGPVVSTVDWTWALGGAPPAGVLVRELTKARGRTVTFRLDAAPTAQFTIDGRDPEAELVEALATDLTLYREGEKLFRGRIGPETDDIGPDGHITQFTALGYRAMLGFRLAPTLPFAFADQADGNIVIDLVAFSQEQTGGDWGIVGGVGTNSGTPRTLTVPDNKILGDLINELARLDGGFEWEIDGDLALNMWHPTRGVNNGVVLDYGGNVNRVNRLLDPKDYANAGVVTGKQGLNPATFEALGLDTEPRGRWELSVGFPNIEEQPILDAKAVWLAAQASVLRPTYSVTLRPGRWAGPSHVWLGDTVMLVIDSGRLNTLDLFRVVEISVQLDEDSNETVTLGLIP